MAYFHRDSKSTQIDLPVGKAVCVGRNYLAHIHELNNEVPSEALLFMKPATTLCSLHEPISIPTHLGECHNEIELAVLIRTELHHCSTVEAKSAIWGIGLALDLTLRDVQTKLKQKGHPWERAKAFDKSCPISEFIYIDEFDDLGNIDFSLKINSEVRQSGNSGMMMRGICDLLCEISRSFTLTPGDVVLTGTPKGVGPLHNGDQLDVSLANNLIVSTRVIGE